MRQEISAQDLHNLHVKIRIIWLDTYMPQGSSSFSAGTSISIQPVLHYPTSKLNADAQDTQPDI